MNCIEVIQANSSFKISCVRDIKGGIRIENNGEEYYGAKLELSTDLGSNNFLTLFRTSPMDYPYGTEPVFTTVPTLADLKNPGTAEIKRTLHMRGSIRFQTEGGEDHELFPFEDSKYHFWIFKIENTSNLFLGRFKPYTDQGNILAVNHLINRSKGLESPEQSFLDLTWSGQNPFVHRVKSF